MLKLNRTTEYSLMALSYIRGKAGDLTSAREIADYYSLPFEILAKTLQKLKEQGIIASSYGTRGGYSLARNLNTLNLAEFLALMEGPVAVVACSNEEHKTEQNSCEYQGQCGIKKPMKTFNDRLSQFLERISVEELTREEVLKTQSQKHEQVTSEQILIEQSFPKQSFQGEEP